MIETSVIALLGAPTQAEDAPARRIMIRRRAPEHEPPPDPPQPQPARHHLDRRAADLAADGAAAGEADDLLNTSELSEWLGISTQWLEIARSRNFGPKFIRLSPRRVRYLRADVLAWLRSRQHQGTAEYARRAR